MNKTNQTGPEGACSSVNIDSSYLVVLVPCVYIDSVSKHTTRNHAEHNHRTDRFIFGRLIVNKPPPGDQSEE